MRTSKEMATNLVFLNKLPGGVVGYTINGEAVKDSWKKTRVYFNGNSETQTMKLDGKDWKMAISNNEVKNNEKIEDSIVLQPYSSTVLYQ